MSLEKADSLRNLDSEDSKLIPRQSCHVSSQSIHHGSWTNIALRPCMVGRLGSERGKVFGAFISDPPRASIIVMLTNAALLSYLLKRLESSMVITSDERFRHREMLLLPNEPSRVTAEFYKNHQNSERA